MSHRSWSWLVVGLFWSGALVAAAEPAAGPSVEEMHLLDPVWESEVIYGESTVLLQAKSGGPLVGRLACPVAEILEVRNSNREQSYDVSRQVTLQPDGTIELAVDTKAPFLTMGDLFPPTGAPMSYKHRVNQPDVSLLYGPGRWFHDHQVEVTYRRKLTPWKGTVPRFAAGQLPRTIARLKAGEPLIIGVSGDSISAGGDASGLNNVAPHQPAFPELVTRQLRASYPGTITLKNRAVGGWSIANGNSDLEALLAEKPHLIVMAYGMNDVGRRDPAWFKGQAEQFIQRVRAADPTIELILVTPMLGHVEWVHTPRDMFFQYRDELQSLCGPGIVMADLTSVWHELLQHKHDLDLTGNGLNHPNDFGHRLYAQALLSLLVE
ncbi:MAG: SGNH/GDSL hydrolase family protein [Planctomycetota bacterium]|nr:MAG: SGNH/GDSL hydrolase family protein [Planctomycetota bacterium]